jgi:hypothetical protein
MPKPIIMPSLLVGLVDPRAPSRLRYNEEMKQALRNVTSVLRYEDEGFTIRTFFL